LQLESELTEDEKPKYLEKFRKHVNPESFFGDMVELVSPKEPLAVLCHGDCWTNNFLFQYAPDGSISEVRRRHVQCRIFIRWVQAVQCIGTSDDAGPLIFLNGIN
jgi:thiamine kinase-like enzyme